jgi:hypothetical protein
MGMTPEARKRVRELLEEQTWFSTLSTMRKRAFLAEMDNADSLHGAQVGMIAPQVCEEGPSLSFIVFTPSGKAFRIPFPPGFFHAAMDDVSHEVNLIQRRAEVEYLPRETRLERGVRKDVGAMFARFDVGVSEP